MFLENNILGASICFLFRASQLFFHHESLHVSNTFRFMNSFTFIGFYTISCICAQGTKSIVFGNKDMSHGTPLAFNIAFIPIGPVFDDPTVFSSSAHCHLMFDFLFQEKKDIRPQDTQFCFRSHMHPEEQYIFKIAKDDAFPRKMFECSNCMQKFHKK